MNSSDGKLIASDCERVSLPGSFFFALVVPMATTLTTAYFTARKKESGNGTRASSKVCSVNTREAGGDSLCRLQKQEGEGRRERENANTLHERDEQGW